MSPTLASSLCVHYMSATCTKIYDTNIESLSFEYHMHKAFAAGTESQNHIMQHGNK